MASNQVIPVDFRPSRWVPMCFRCAGEMPDRDDVEVDFEGNAICDECAQQQVLAECASAG